VPVSSTFSGVGNGGTITFSEPVELASGGVGTAWTRGVGGSRRPGTAVVQTTATVLTVTVGASLPFALATGWYYSSGTGDVRTVASGVAVASFGPFV